MSDMKNTLEQLVLEKQQAEGLTRQVAAILTAVVAKAEKQELRLTKTDLAAAERFGVNLDSVGKGGVKLTLVEQS